MTDEQRHGMTDQEVQVVLRGALPLQDALVIGIVPPQKPAAQGLAGHLLPQVITVVWVDTAQRPDIRDLGRVHAVEGKGEVTCTWMYIDEKRPGSYFVLTVAMLRPVRTSFSIAFHLPEYAALMEIVSQTGSLSLVPGPPIEWRKLIHQFPPESLLERIYQQGGDDTTMTMSSATTAELRRHFETWKRHQPARG